MSILFVLKFTEIRNAYSARITLFVHVLETFPFDIRINSYMHT